MISACIEVFNIKEMGQKYFWLFLLIMDNYV